MDKRTKRLVWLVGVLVTLVVVPGVMADLAMSPAGDAGSTARQRAFWGGVLVVVYGVAVGGGVWLMASLDRRAAATGRGNPGSNRPAPSPRRRLDRIA